ncbi:MAG TPA: hypothetical protein VFF30_12445 [Nitrososphaerales archaeon]|nr:hypothetical protein [Nitrososphaerales archaeon]
MSSEPLSLVNSSINLDDIVKTLEALGFRCTVGGTLRGISGASHKFDIVCKGIGTRITIQFLANQTQEGCEVALVSSRAKFYDCSPDLGIIICRNAMNPTLKGLSTFFRLSVIEAIDTRDVCEKLSDLLSENSLTSCGPPISSESRSDSASS